MTEHTTKRQGLISLRSDKQECPTCREYRDDQKKQKNQEDRDRRGNQYKQEGQGKREKQYKQEGQGKREKQYKQEGQGKQEKQYKQEKQETQDKQDSEIGKMTGVKRLRDVLQWRNILVLCIAGMINAFGVTIFLFPVDLYDSGISGLSMLLDQVTPPHMTLSLFLLVFNIPVFLYGMKKQGKTFTVYSILAVFVYSFVSYLIMDVLPVDVELVSPLAGRDLLLCAIFGGVISGVGSGLTIRFGGAIDGIDVLSVIFSKKLGLSLGGFVLIFNTCLYIVCGLAIKSWILPLYSIVTYYVGSRVVDFVVEGLDRSKCAMIVTVKAQEIAQILSEQFESSGTLVDAVGGYSGEHKKIVYFIINHFQINHLKKIVHDIDPTAFITLQEVTDIIRSPE